MSWVRPGLISAGTALTGLLTGVIYFSLKIAGRRPTVGRRKSGLTGNPTARHLLAAPADQVERRLAVIHGSARFLLEHPETEEVKRTLCRLIMEEAENLAVSLHPSSAVPAGPCGMERGSRIREGRLGFS